MSCNTASAPSPTTIDGQIESSERSKRVDNSDVRGIDEVKEKKLRTVGIMNWALFLHFPTARFAKRSLTSLRIFEGFVIPRM